MATGAGAGGSIVVGIAAIAAVGFGVGAGAVAVWSVLLIAVSHVTAARNRDDTLALVGYGALIAGCALLFAAALVAGFLAMTHE